MDIDNPFASETEGRRFSQFVDELSARGRRPATIRAYTSDWIDLSCWFRRVEKASFEAGLLNAAHIRAWRDGALKKGRSGATAARRLAFARTYAQWLAAEGWLAREVCDDMKTIEALPTTHRSPKLLSPPEVRALCLQVDAHGCLRDQAVIYTLLGTGMKVGELVSMTVGQLDLPARRIVIPGRRCVIPISDRVAWRLGWSLMERGFPGHVLDPDLPSPPASRLMITSPMPLSAGPRDEHQAVFVGERGPLTANAVQRVVRKHGQFARVDASPQVLRHIFAVQYAVKFKDPVTLAELLGLESLDAARVYLRLAEQYEGESWEEAA
ncbi:MAG: tyrosine-type recombinase/integrase [Bradymonadia bacterium]